MSSVDRLLKRTPPLAALIGTKYSSYVCCPKRIKVGLSSNTVTAAVVMPVMIALVLSHNLPLKGILIPVSLTMALAFIFVASSPSNIVPYSTGYFSILDMVKSGIIVTVVTSVLIALSIFTIGSFMGIY